ncbi:phosphoribosylaminoimidazole-succinocarboxamide synthase [Actinoplanes lobatus]|uniref:Phosphoribosylaminoimidazole-succinocarboxamide synthase n=2 Tax=Actinoplanes TaxID=1865 RepID=A0A7W5FH99_9ACTN|nr:MULTISPECIES: phosphoribosylaminoimidazolesuccinocarboxamide synthase [Actinoplanes]MBB3098275.1 phosphoribosylaminoimidazole-succinocarboxamide synthase [Actinoplanes campanulatus]MBB4747637.1 phosphoribosylaminoimidazole-succinocarboxamide synthase [Actinoplanes lobatus]GGN34610.1 phosphoribosylaminoimidazole-succinocarboxamide synthase [Actinoplanes campanulatus]GGN73692.1 phosphoribosylaminoimidazole-succinocarboxamide synthase [Actinoplanes lobatus]GID38766.1 phosphoribosylaminoimidazo
MELLHSGKVRDVYADGDDLILVTSDRISIYDVILPTPIPDKGKILTQLSLWWFDQLSDVIPNHVISATDVPAEWSGRAIRCERLEMVMVECIARGYLAGSGLKDYERNRTISGNVLPEGLVESSRLPEPIFTPSTKEPVGGGHDEPLTFEQTVDRVGKELAEELRRVTLEVYRRGSEIAAAKGIVIADTKIEVGYANGTLKLGDEVLTPDSSRFWGADEWKPGSVPRYLDKQFLRDWSGQLTDWNRTAPGPEIPDEVVEATRNRYVEVYERLTGDRWR